MHHTSEFKYVVVKVVQLAVLSSLSDRQWKCCIHDVHGAFVDVLHTEMTVL